MSAMVHLLERLLQRRLEPHRVTGPDRPGAAEVLDHVFLMVTDGCLAAGTRAERPGPGKLRAALDAGPHHDLEVSTIFVTVASATVCTTLNRKNGDTTENAVPDVGAEYRVVRSESRVLPSTLASIVGVDVPPVNLNPGTTCVNPVASIHGDVSGEAACVSAVKYSHSRYPGGVGAITCPSAPRRGCGASPRARRCPAAGS